MYCNNNTTIILKKSGTQFSLGCCLWKSVAITMCRRPITLKISCKVNQTLFYNILINSNGRLHNAKWTDFRQAKFNEKDSGISTAWLYSVNLHTGQFFANLVRL